MNIITLLQIKSELDIKIHATSIQIQGSLMELVFTDIPPHVKRLSDQLSAAFYKFSSNFADQNALNDLIQILSRSYYSQSDFNKLSSDEQAEMIMTHDIIADGLVDWANILPSLKTFQVALNEFVQCVTPENTRSNMLKYFQQKTGELHAKYAPTVIDNAIAIARILIKDDANVIYDAKRFFAMQHEFSIFNLNRTTNPMNPPPNFSDETTQKLLIDYLVKHFTRDSLELFKVCAQSERLKKDKSTLDRLFRKRKSGEDGDPQVLKRAGLTAPR